MHSLALRTETLRGESVAEVVFTDAGLDLREREVGTAAADAHRELGARLGVPVVRMGQTHGAEVAVVGRSTPELVPGVDALVTRQRGIALVARGADCGLVLLADVDHGVVAAVHSGRRGLVAGVVPAAVDRMRSLGARDVHGWIGPHACGRCYEVPDTMRDEVARVVPEAAGVTSWGTPSVDLGAGLRAQLDSRDVRWQELGICTLEDGRVWSYRRDGAAAGRTAGVIWMQP